MKYLFLVLFFLLNNNLFAGVSFCYVDYKSPQGYYTSSNETSFVKDNVLSGFDTRIIAREELIKKLGKDNKFSPHCIYIEVPAFYTLIKYVRKHQDGGNKISYGFGYDKKDKEKSLKNAIASLSGNDWGWNKNQHNYETIKSGYISEPSNKTGFDLSCSENKNINIKIKKIFPKKIIQFESSNNIVVTLNLNNNNKINNIENTLIEKFCEKDYLTNKSIGKSLYKFLQKQTNELMKECSKDFESSECSKIEKETNNSEGVRG